MGHALKIDIYVDIFIIFIGHFDQLTKDIYWTKAKITGLLPVSDGPLESLLEGQLRNVALFHKVYIF